jgi:hypothetical protein
MTHKIDEKEMRDILEWRARRNRAFEEDDIDFFLAIKPGMDPISAEMGFHKARAACTAISPQKREESRMWLASRGIGLMHEIEISEWMRKYRVIHSLVAVIFLFILFLFVIALVRIFDIFRVL